MPIPIGISEWSQRSSRPDEEPIYIDDPRVGEAVRKSFSDFQVYEDRSRARAYLRSLKEGHKLTLEEWRDAWERIVRMQQSGNAKSVILQANLWVDLEFDVFREFLITAIDSRSPRKLHEKATKFLLARCRILADSDED